MKSGNLYGAIELSCKKVNVKLMHLLSSIASKRRQKSCTSDRGQQSVWDAPPAISTFLPKYFKKDCTSPYRLVPGSNWNALVCSVELSVGSKLTFSAFSTVVYKDRLPGISASKEKLFLCLCSGLSLPLLVCLIVQELFLSRHRCLTETINWPIKYSKKRKENVGHFHMYTAFHLSRLFNIGMLMFDLKYQNK